MDYIYKKSGSIFNAHSYWTKQPIEVIENFIKKNTKKGDIVLDPFCGSGMTGVAAIKTNRRFLLSDISPICIHISKGYCNKVNIDEVLQYLPWLLNSINYLFETKCPHCGEKTYFDYCILEDELQNKKTLTLKNVVLHCSCSKEKIKKYPDKKDIIGLNNKDYLNMFYPRNYFFGNEPKRNYKRGIYQIFQLYSKRNLSALAILKEKINEISNENIRQFYLFAFSSILFNCSLMSRYNPKYENTQIKMGSYYIPQFIKDNNVSFSFERKVKSLIKANKEIFFLNTLFDGKIVLNDATNLSQIKDNSIDYIYTDPPYSDKISYAELNIVYESWLGKGLTKIEDEMIVSKASGKDIEHYSKSFSKFFLEARRVLKENKKITLIFHNSSIEHWAYFQKSIICDGLRPTITDSPNRLISSAKTSTQYQTSKDSQCFLLFEFTKKSNFCSHGFLQELTEEKYINLIDKLRKKSIDKGFVNYSDQFDYIINYLVLHVLIKPNIKI